MMTRKTRTEPGADNGTEPRRAEVIFYLAKVFQKREYADKFIRGEMYCNRLSWFKKLEDQEGRSDTDEGAIVPQLEDCLVTLEVSDPDTGKVVDRHTMQGNCSELVRRIWRSPPPG